MQITKIEVQKKRKDRYNIFIDDEFKFGLDEGTLIKFDLRKGIEITQEEIEKIENEEVNAKAFNVAANFLKTRERSKKEIRDKLKMKEYLPSVIEKVLEKLERLNIVNDKRFAEMFVRDRTRLNPKGRRALQMELAQKGIDKKTIEEVLLETFSEDVEAESLKKIFEKAEKKYSGFEDQEKKQKIIKYLFSKGFSWDIIESITNN